jgi:ribose-phosphate pyrophosphokinase
MIQAKVITRIDFPSTQSYNVIRYPGGETQVRIVPQFVEPISKSDEIIINARVSSAQDFIELALLSDALYWCAKKAVQVLRIPYLPYARADRRFVGGDCNGLAVFCMLITACSFNRIEVLDVHNEQAVKPFLDNFIEVRPTALINLAIADIGLAYGKGAILLPDAGAAKRYTDFGWPVFFATKKRNPETGRLEGFSVPENIPDGPILIVDDICDGGGTFLGIAGQLPGRDLFLYVTHGIFSKGLSALAEKFRHIYTTDSIKRAFSVDDSFMTEYSAFDEIEFRQNRS